MNDGKIVEMFTKRDESALSESKKSYGAYCLSIAGNILYDNQDAEECLNDVLLAAWNSIPPNAPENLKTYLGKLTREIAIDKWRMKNAKKRTAPDTVLPFEELENMIGDSVIEETVEDNELSECISAYLRTLRKTERNVFVRRYWYYDPIGKICERYGFSKGKVVMMLKRTRDRLAEHLRKEGLMK